jgi:2-phospho-L-lactate guanylyltransferase (CobY/MobA/RfbA family)
MSNMIPKVMREGFVDQMNKDVITSVHQKVAEIDLHTVKVSELDFASSFDLTITRYDNTNGFIVWFDTDFTLGHEVISLKTGKKNLLIFLKISFLIE